MSLHVHVKMVALSLNEEATLRSSTSRSLIWPDDKRKRCKAGGKRDVEGHRCTAAVAWSVEDRGGWPVADFALRIPIVGLVELETG